MATGQVVRLVNEGDQPFRDMFNSQPYTIPAKGQLFVDYDAMCLWMGHPEANDRDPRNRVRVAEYHRIRGRYGVDAKALEQSLKGEVTDPDSLFDSLRPRLVAYDASTGNQIITVADDPSGDSLSPVLEVSGDNQSLILARMQQMEAEMANLRQQLANNARTEQALNDAQPIGVDNPDMSDVVVPHASGIPGTIQETPAQPETIVPRPTPRTTPGEDEPTRVRVTS